MELRDNAVSEWVQDKSIQVPHVAGKCNLSNIFTKEVEDSITHFRHLCDSFICHLSNFVPEPLAPSFQFQLPDSNPVAK